MAETRRATLTFVLLAASLALTTDLEGQDARNGPDLPWSVGRRTLRPCSNEILKRLGCDMAQGYFISRPLPSTEFLTWMRESRWGVRSEASAGR